jgi:hypothetical protein
MTRKERLVDYVGSEHYSDILSTEGRKQFAREWINNLNNLEFLELLDEVFKDDKP